MRYLDKNYKFKSINKFLNFEFADWNLFQETPISFNRYKKFQKLK